ncbi:MAG: PEGA domain-containing protein, partial [Myxococcota bacterium]
MLATMLGACVMVAHVPTPAQAQEGKPVEEMTDDEKKAAAKTAFLAGNEKFKAGDYAGALPLFREADSYYPGAAPKHKIAVSLDKLGKAEEAQTAYQAFIDSNPGEKYTDKVAEAKQRIEELKGSMPATVNVVIQPAGAASAMKVTVDGQPTDGMPLKLAPGDHIVLIEAEGYEPKEEKLTVAAGETKDLAVTLVAAAPVPAPAPAPPEKKVEPPVEEEEEGPSNVPAIITLGIAGAGVVVGTIFGVQALSDKSTFDDDPTTENADNAERAALIADMSFGVALTFGI